MTANETNKPLKTFRVFGIEASVWPPKADQGDDSPKIRIGRSYRDKEGNFRNTSYFAPKELAVAMEQAMKALIFTAPELVDETIEHLFDIVRLMGEEATAPGAEEAAA
jgi:hypothetical protein